MKLIDVYKNIPVGELGDDTYLRVAEPHRCCCCGELTEFVEINYQAYFCSTECEDKMTVGYVPMQQTK